MLYIVAGTSLLLLLGAYVGRAQLATLGRELLTPPRPFAGQEPPPAPDYAVVESWAALPDRPDGADITPIAGTRDEQARAAADVFFLYAGSNWSAHWNLPIDDWFGRPLVDGGLVPAHASIWNGCCRVYVPRIRQESGWTPAGGERDHEQAIDLAYGDVRRAFRQYVAQYSRNRPLIIAGANSGARHALRLLSEEIAGSPLQARLIAAYLVNVDIDRAAQERLRGIPICEDATQIGCVNTWSTLGRQRFAETPAKDDVACVNPLSWRRDGVLVPREQNHGGIRGSLLAAWTGERPQPIAAMADAQCARGHLWVTPNPDIRDAYQPGGPGDYHPHNFSFFYANVRENAQQRVRAFLEQAAPAVAAQNTSAKPGAAPASSKPADLRARRDQPQSGGGGCSEPVPLHVPGATMHDWPGALPAVLR